LSLQTPLTAKTGAVSAAIAVDYNAISLHTQVASPNNPQQQYGLDSGKVNGSFQDSVTINAPGKTGARGFLVVEYLVKGSFSVSGAIDPDSQTFADYQYDLRVGNGFGAEHDPYVQGFYRVFADGTVESGSRDILNKKGQFSPAFTFGSPFPVNWTLASWVRSSQRRPDNYVVDITNACIRIVAVLDDQGKPVSGFSMTSESGTAYGEPKLWAAGRDLADNEKPDGSAETNSVNETVPQWSYGYRSSATGTDLTLFTAAQHTNTSPGRAGNPNPAQEAVEGWDPDAVVTVNTGNTDVVYDFGFGPLKPLLPGQMYFHPSASNGFAVARWTAPAAGRYNIVARWLDLDNHGGNGFSCHVVIKGVAVFNQDVANDGGVDIPLQNVDLNAGDIVDFVVGSRGDFSFDSTGFNAAISVAPAVQISVPGAAAGKVTVTEGSTLSVTANVLFENPAATVELRDNGMVIARDNTAPYQFAVDNISSGFHRLMIVAVDNRGIEGTSDTVDVTVNKAPVAAASAASDNSAQPAGATATGRSYEFTESGGNWSDPTRWTPHGVPGPGDNAHVANNAFVVLDQNVTVDYLVVSLGCTLQGLTGENQRFLTVQKGIFLDGDLTGFSLQILEQATFASTLPKGSILPEPTLTDMLIINRGTTVLSQDILGKGSTLSQNTGKITVQAPPASNRTTQVTIPQLQHDGGSLSIAPGSKLVTGSAVLAAPTHMVAAGAGNIVAAGAGNLIGSDGASLIGSDGASLRGPDGAPLVGSDGASLVGNAGNTIAPFAAEGATAPSGIVLKPGAVITGRGNIVGDVINEGGFVAPGSGPTDVIRILGNYTQQSQATLVLDVGGTSANPPQYDQLQIFGTATLGGNLVVNSVGGFTPEQGDSFTPLTYTSASGNFTSITSNAQVTVGSTGVTMKVTGPNPPAPKALNIATRMKVETGDNVLIAGFIITGPQPKKVIIRGIGPSLPFGGVLANPTLNLDNGAVTNDNWRTNQEQEIIATTIPPSNNLESAIVATLAPGPHTAILAGAGGATGTGVVEVYDLDSGSPVQLANIASRGFVQSGDNVMIGGFIIGGDYPTRVIIRAIGPSLPFAGVLQDPTLELVDSNGSRISNDNWRATQEAEIIATSVPPTHEKEAAIFATLVPGSYTAVVRGKDDTTGIAVVEAYNLQ
jgi:hypothetical protein